MLLLQRLLLLPLLAPLLMVVLVGAINPRPLVALRLLTWTSPTLSIGLWLSIAAGGGAAISAAATGLALRLGPGAQALPSRSAFQAGPSRAPGEPAPTVAVPFRVIRKAQTASTPPPHAPEAKATAVGDGWDQAASDDW